MTCQGEGHSGLVTKSPHLHLATGSKRRNSSLAVSSPLFSFVTTPSLGIVGL